MELKIVKRFPLVQAFEAAENALLENTGEEKVLFYENASMRLAEFDPEELNPVSLYLLQKNIDFQIELRAHLLRQYEIDTLKQNEVLHLQDKDGKIHSLIPPYVEISTERVVLLPKKGDRQAPPCSVVNIPLIIDGLHRAEVARALGLNLFCITVRTKKTLNYPYAAYPVSWSEVQIYPEVPKVKKLYRRQDPYTFMRPLDAMRLLQPDQSEYGR